MTHSNNKAVPYATPVKPLTGKAQHCVWAGTTPEKQIRAASFAYHRQSGKTAWVAIHEMRLDVKEGKTRYPAFHPDANPDYSAYGETRVRCIENPTALGLRLVGLAHDVAPANYRFSHAAVDHSGWFLDLDEQDESVSGVVYQTSGKGGRARYLYGYADPWNCDKSGHGPATLSLEPVSGCRLGGDCDGDFDEVLRDVARAGDSMAESMANQERAYQESFRAGEHARGLAREAYNSGCMSVTARRAARAMWPYRNSIVPTSTGAVFMRDLIREQISLARSWAETFQEERDAARAYRAEHGHGWNCENYAAFAAGYLEGN